MTAAAQEGSPAEVSLAEKVVPDAAAAAAAAPAPALSRPWLHKRNSTLPPPPAFCPLIYAPVCGTNNVTYPNKCVAESRRASVAHAGPCEGQEGALRRPYSFGRPGSGGGGRAPAPAPSAHSSPPSSTLAAAAAPVAAVSAPEPHLRSSSSSLAATRRAQPLNSELAAAASKAEREERELEISSSDEEEEEEGGGAESFVAPVAAEAAEVEAAEAAEAELQAEAEAEEAELKAEAEAEEAVKEKSDAEMETADDEGGGAERDEAAAEEAAAASADNDTIILAPPSPFRPIAACPRNYMPVCATVPSAGAARTFDNDCLARAEGALVARPGACSGAAWKTPRGVIVPIAASGPAAEAASLRAPAVAAAAVAAAAPAASRQQQPLATPATREQSPPASSGSGGFSSFVQRSPPSTKYRLPAIESPEEQAALAVGGGDEI